jgi:hypothetical protein
MDQRQTIIDSHRQIILQLRDIEKQIEKMLASNDPQWRQLEVKRSALQRQVEPLIDEYWKWIPSVELSQCPFCQKPLFRRFDAYDINGFWWMDRTQREIKESEACEHFCLLSGALNLNGHSVKGGLFECRPGPDKPFVFPRLLQMPSMVVVIGEIPMSCGYMAYPIVYFSKEKIESYHLTQSWARKDYSVTLTDGRSGWNIREDKQDFNLRNWISLNKIFIYRKNKLIPLKEEDSLLKIEGRERNQTIFNNILTFESFLNA